MAEEEQKGYGGYGGKRPLWQWIIIYLVIGAILYGLIYYFVFAKGGGSYTPPTGVIPTPTSAALSPTESSTTASPAP